MTDPHRRQTIRFAGRLLESIASRRQHHPPPLPEYEWTRLEETVRQQNYARSRGWNAAGSWLQRIADRDLRSLIERLQDLKRSYDGQARKPSATLRDVLQDMQALEQEFVDVRIDLRQKSLACTTDDITLEGVALGPFRIVLHCDQLHVSQPYDVVALDPSPAAESSSTPHPHVRDDGLCEGEGRVPIRRALEQGRIYDFFVLVRQVLQTYNPGSAYIPLGRWSGVSCADCTAVASDDDSLMCALCDADLCLDCGSACRACHHTTCASCTLSCMGCEESACSSCLGGCEECSHSFCRTCLTDGLCQSCQSASLASECPTHDNDLTETAPVPADSAVGTTNAELHALRLG